MSILSFSLKEFTSLLLVFLCLNFGYGSNHELYKEGTIVEIPAGIHTTPETDSLALVALYEATDGPNWEYPWDLHQPVYSWAGLRTDINGRVTEIFLSYRGLTGAIPKELGQLTSLMYIQLHNNKLTGPIPKELGQLSNLILLQLHNNELTGSIPKELGQLTNLTRLHLQNNQLSGCFDENLMPLCDIDYNFSNNPGLPHRGDFNTLCLRENNCEVGNIGLTDFQITTEGVVTDRFGSYSSGIVYNPQNKEYLLIYGKSEASSFLAFEIYGQRIDDKGNPIGTNHFRISYTGTEGEDNYYAQRPKVAYNSVKNEYLVVWQGQDNLLSGGQLEREIYGQLLDNVGNPIGVNFRITDVGVTGSHGYALKPEVVYNTTRDEYLVIWVGSEITDGKWEVYGQRLDASGNQVGTNDFKISSNGLDGSFSNHTALTYNTVSKQYLIAWAAKKATNDTQNIYIQLIDYQGNSSLSSDLKIITSTIESDYPSVDYNPLNGDYFIAWQGKKDTGSHQEIHGKLINQDGSEKLPNDFQISNVALTANNSLSFRAWQPAVNYNSISEEYLVVFNEDYIVFGKEEIFGRRFDLAGNAKHNYPFKVSNVSVTEDPSGYAYTPELVYNNSQNEHLAIWHGRKSLYDGTRTTIEVFGQRLQFPACIDDNNLGNKLLDNGFYSAAHNLTAATTIQMNSNVAFTAGISIKLLPGFNTQTNSTFSASIEDCPSNNLVGTTANNRAVLKTTPNIISNELYFKISPNPIRHQAIIEYKLSTASKVNLIVSDIKGRQIKTLVSNTYLEAGTHQISFLPDNLKKGVYFISLQTKDKIQIQKIILLE